MEGLSLGQVSLCFPESRPCKRWSRWGDLWRWSRETGRCIVGDTGAMRQTEGLGSPPKIQHWRMDGSNQMQGFLGFKVEPPLNQMIVWQIDIKMIYFLLGFYSHQVGKVRTEYFYPVFSFGCDNRPIGGVQSVGKSGNLIWGSGILFFCSKTWQYHAIPWDKNYGSHGRERETLAERNKRDANFDQSLGNLARSGYVP